jgi:hypothetical protein
MVGIERLQAPPIIIHAQKSAFKEVKHLILTTVHKTNMGMGMTISQKKDNSPYRDWVTCPHCPL